MKLSQLSSSETTQLELKHPVNGGALGVVITGHTPDSAAWRKAQQEIVSGDSQSLILEKGLQRIELDPDSREKRDRMLTSIVTNITGIEDWEFSPEAVKKLFQDPKYGWMLEQWSEHLDDRKNFFGSSAKSAKSGSKT